MVKVVSLFRRLVFGSIHTGSRSHAGGADKYSGYAGGRKSARQRVLSYSLLATF